MIYLFMAPTINARTQAIAALKQSEFPPDVATFNITLLDGRTQNRRHFAPL
jgi:hypothetical protein